MFLLDLVTMRSIVVSVSSHVMLHAFRGLQMSILFTESFINIYAAFIGNEYIKFQALCFEYNTRPITNSHKFNTTFRFVSMKMTAFYKNNCADD